jgi:hypothetical protein
MALLSECTQSCAQKVLDTADIVRDAMFQQLSVLKVSNRSPLIDLPVSPK